MLTRRTITLVAAALTAAALGAQTGTVRGIAEYGAIPRASANNAELVLARRPGAAEGNLHTVRPDAGGRFAIEGLEPGPWELTLRASDERYRHFFATAAVVVQPGSDTEAAFRVPAGGATLVIESRDNPPFTFGLFAPGVAVSEEDITSRAEMEAVQRLFGQKTHDRSLVYQADGGSDLTRYERLPAGRFDLVLVANDWQKGDPPLRPKRVPLVLEEGTTTTLVLGRALREARVVAPGAPDMAGAFAVVARWWRGEVQRLGVVGASLMLVKDGRIHGEAHEGFADLEERRAVDRDTIYHWASCTKTFTGIAIMQLEARGRLGLDDPVVRYLPELRACHNPHGPMEAVTIRHLLSHTAGFRGPTWPWGGDRPWHPHEPTRWEQLVAMMSYTEVMFPPGSRYSYSNPGIVFLGRVIEVLSGDDYEVYVDKNVLKPLGMHRSYFDHTPYHLLRNRSNNYRLEDGRPVAQGLDFDTGVTVSNGGLNASLSDMARYLAFLAGAAAIDDGARGVLDRGRLARMWEPVAPIGDDPALGAMGLTFFVRASEGRRFVGHTGGQKAFVTFFLVDPEGGAAALGAFNTVGGPGGGTGALSAAVQDRLRREVLPLPR